jgi:hypothetical protein
MWTVTRSESVAVFYETLSSIQGGDSLSASEASWSWQFLIKNIFT